MPIFLVRLALSPAHQSLRYRTALFLYALIIVLGSLPGARADIGNYASGLLLHSCAYAILGALLFSGSPGSAAMRAVKSWLTVAAMGAGDEFVQSFFPYRHASVGDWAVDCSAAALVSLLLWQLWPRLTARLS